MNAATLTAPVTVTRHVGNCQLCERDQKLTDGGHMVHHGYKRPGHGNIEGDCPGVGKLPYEVSCEAIKTYLDGLRNQLAFVRTRLGQFARGEVLEFSRLVWGRPGRHHNARMELQDYAVGVTDPFIFADGLRCLKGELQSSDSQLTHAIARCEVRIAHWTPKPVRTVEEEARKAQADKDARKAEREAARAVRAAKAAATRAKADAREAARKATLDGFIQRLRDLSAQPPSEGRDAAADKLYGEMTHKKNDWFYLSQLHVPELFVAVGLGTYSGGPDQKNGWGDRFTNFHRTNGSDRRS